jgi:hypothetical protein
VQTSRCNFLRGFRRGRRVRASQRTVGTVGSNNS